MPLTITFVLELEYLIDGSMVMSFLYYCYGSTQPNGGAHEKKESADVGRGGTIKMIPL